MPIFIYLSALANTEVVVLLLLRDNFKISGVFSFSQHCRLIYRKFTKQRVQRTNINHIYNSLYVLSLLILIGNLPESLWSNFNKDSHTHPQSSSSWRGRDEETEPGAAAPHHEALWGSWWPGRRCCVSPAGCHTPWCSAQRCPPRKLTMKGDISYLVDGFI